MPDLFIVWLIFNKGICLYSKVCIVMEYVYPGQWVLCCIREKNSAFLDVSTKHSYFEFITLKTRIKLLIKLIKIILKIINNKLFYVREKMRGSKLITVWSIWGNNNRNVLNNIHRNFFLLIGLILLSR